MVAFASKPGVGQPEAVAAERARQVGEINTHAETVRALATGGTLSDGGMMLTLAALRALLGRLNEPEMRQAEQRVPGLGKD